MISIVLLWSAVYLTGILISKISGEKEAGQLWIHLIGFFFLFFSQGIVFTLAQLLDWSFGQARSLLVLVLGAASLLGLLAGRREIAALPQKLKELFHAKEKKTLYLALVGWLWLGIWMALGTGMVMNRQDALLETMQTTLLTDTLNKVHPFTGQPMELGVVFSRRIQTLPFWYAALQSWTGFSAQDTVWVWGSFFTITFSLMAFTELASLLFARELQKTWMFACLLELLILSGDYFSGAAGYRLLFYGYAGETIVGFVAVPAVLIILYRFLTPWFHHPEEEGDGAKLGPVGTAVQLALVVGTSLFLAPLLWGPVLLVVAILFGLLCLGVICLVKRVRRKQ